MLLLRWFQIQNGKSLERESPHEHFTSWPLKKAAHNVVSGTLMFCPPATSQNFLLGKQERLRLVRKFRIVNKLEVGGRGGGGGGRGGQEIGTEASLILRSFGSRNSTMISHGLQKKALSACQAWRLLSSIVVHGFCALPIEALDCETSSGSYINCCYKRGDMIVRVVFMLPLYYISRYNVN